MPTGAQLKLAGDACATCPASTGTCVPPEANPNAKLAIVGEGPGRNEIREGIPFIGRSGHMLRRGLRTLGLVRSDVHWTNAVLCDCSEDDLPEARKACQKRLAEELAATTAPVIMPVGRYALQSTLQSKKRLHLIGKHGWRGSVTPKEIGGVERLVAPTVHPAFVMRVPKWGPILELDVARVGRLLRGGYKAPEHLAGRTIEFVRDYSRLNALASLDREVSFDVETVGLGPMYTALVCLGISDGQSTYVLPWANHTDGRESAWSEPRLALEAVNDCFGSRLTISHNGPVFDHIIAHRYSIRLRRWADTLLMYHALHSHFPKGLAHVVSVTLDAPAWKEVPHSESLDVLMGYNAQDALYTKLAYDVLAKELQP